MRFVFQGMWSFNRQQWPIPAGSHFPPRSSLNWKQASIVPGTMEVHIVDALGGTPYTDWVPKPNFHGPTLTYFDRGPDGIQLFFDTPVGLIHS
jgi:hypothetical protein